jgi:hypothetical protein
MEISGFRIRTRLTYYADAMYSELLHRKKEFSTSGRTNGNGIQRVTDMLRDFGDRKETSSIEVAQELDIIQNPSSFNLLILGTEPLKIQIGCT